MMLHPALFSHSASVMPLIAVRRVRTVDSLFNTLEPCPWLGCLDISRPTIFEPASFIDYWQLIGGTAGALLLHRNARRFLRIAKAADTTSRERSYLSIRYRRLVASLVLSTIPAASPRGNQITVKSYLEMYLRLRSILEVRENSLAEALDLSILAE